MIPSRVFSSERNDICWISFGNEKANSFTPDLLKQLTAAVTTASRANMPIAITSDGKNFSGGASKDAMESCTNFESAREFFELIAHLLLAIIEAPVPVLSFVQGKAVGGAVGLVAACDITFAGSDAAVSLPELRIGVAPSVIGPVIEKKIGDAHFYRIAISGGDWFLAPELLTWGLFSDKGDLGGFKEKAREVASLYKNNPQGFQMLKSAFWGDTQRLREVLIERAAFSGKLLVQKGK